MILLKIGNIYTWFEKTLWELWFYLFGLKRRRLRLRL